jgi:hypothetical protein
MTNDDTEIALSDAPPAFSIWATVIEVSAVIRQGPISEDGNDACRRARSTNTEQAAIVTQIQPGNAVPGCTMSE